MLVAYIIGISITPVEENVILLSTTTMFLYLTFGTMKDNMLFVRFLRNNIPPYICKSQW